MPAKTVTALVPLTQAESMLANASTFEDFKNLRDTAEAARAFARARHMGIDNENLASEYILRAERGMGSVLIEMGEAGTRATRGRNRYADDAASSLPTLMDLTGIDHPQRASAAASNWQALARIPEDDFESRFATVKATGTRIAKVDFYRLVKGVVAKANKVPEAVAEMHGDGFTPAYSAFRQATQALIRDIGQLPADEMLSLAADIKGLASAYNEQRAARIAA